VATGQGWCFRLVDIHHPKDLPPEAVLRQFFWVFYIDGLLSDILILYSLALVSGLPGIETIFVLFIDVAMMIFVRPFSPD
jgi:bacteriorhodopsin